MERERERLVEIERESEVCINCLRMIIHSIDLKEDVRLKL